MRIRTLGPRPAYDSDKQEVRTSQSPIEEEITEYWAQKIAANYAKLRARYVIQPHTCRPGTHAVTRPQRHQCPPQTIAEESLEGYEAADERSASDEDEPVSQRYSTISAHLQYLDELRTSPIPVPSDYSDTSSIHTSYTPRSTQPSPVRNFLAMFDGRDNFGNLVDDSSMSKDSDSLPGCQAEGSG